jgi:hypothetical protein
VASASGDFRGDMRLKKQMPWLISVVLFAGIVAWFQYGEFDREDLPSKIHVRATVSEGKHVHALVLFAPTKPIYLLCTGVFGEGLKYEHEVYPDIPTDGIDIPLKKKWLGICGFKFNLMEITCSESKINPKNDDQTFPSVLLGLLDTSENAKSKPGNIFRSENRIRDNSLLIRTNGSKANFWGCADDCEDSEDFGLNQGNTNLNINCKDSASDDS